MLSEQRFTPSNGNHNDFISDDGHRIQPIFSSRNLDWNNVICEYYRLPPCEFPEQKLQEHVVTIHLGYPSLLEVNQGGKLHQGCTLKGHIIYTPAGMKCQSRSKQEQEILHLSIDPIFVEQVFNDSMHAAYECIHPQFNTPDPLIYQIGLALKAELKSGKNADLLYVRSLTNTLVVHLFQQYSRTGMRVSAEPFVTGLPNRKLHSVLEYIESNLDKDLKLVNMAEVVQMNLHHFTRAFKQSMGVPPHKYLQTKRIEAAKALLEMNLPIFEVMQRTGFQSQSHFTRLFRDYTLMTPKEYQRKQP